MENRKPFVWQMITEAIDALNGKALYSEIKEYINSKWDDVNDSTINCQIITMTVNMPSRINWPENSKPRLSNCNSKYDLLYSIGRGKVVKYNIEEHGLWEIYKNEFGAMAVRQVITEDFDNVDTDISEETNTFCFPIEANLRDFLIQNLSTIKGHKLKLFVDENQRNGREYPTEVGIIDILTVDENGDFIVLELKLSHGVDKALGQLLRYMGWVKQKIAKEKKVKGIIVANKMDEKIKYAVSVLSDVSLYEYEMKFELNKVNNQ